MAGRPSKYQPSYCNLVIEQMAEGRSLTAFAADIGVSRSTLHAWIDVEPDFADAVGIAKAKCAAWWEARARAGAMAEQGINATLVIFGLKNMAPQDWREKQEVEHSGAVRYDRIEMVIVDPQAQPDATDARRVQ